MEQYFAIKNQYPSCILFFRLGDFYEMFFEDALTASRELDIVLTGRECGREERAPMCGVPYHAADGYIAKLVEKGYHVAICEQVEDPRQAKGIVRRDVVRIVTPGTVTDSSILDEGRNNFIACVHANEKYISYAAADITTGFFVASALPVGEENKFADEFSRFNPAETIADENIPRSLRTRLDGITGRKSNTVPSWTFLHANAFKCLTDHFGTAHLEGFGFKKDAPEIPAAGALVRYLYETQKNSLSQITSIKQTQNGSHMVLDAPSRRNLELTQSIRGSKKDSLLGVLDRTKTAMGARLIRSWIEQPLINPAEINKRLDAVGEWKDFTMPRAELRELLGGIYDLERLVSRLVGSSANARDLHALRASLEKLPHIETLLCDFECELNKKIRETFDDLSDVRERIGSIIEDDPPFGVREGGMIRRGFDAELDNFIEVKTNGGEWLSQIESKEREKTGIKNLKIRFNKVFGYYIEISNSNKRLAPENYVRRQTLANCERFVTEELKRLEETILGAEEKQNELEYQIFDALRREVVEQITRIQFTAYSVAALDALQSLADAAEKNGYAKPVVNDGSRISIFRGRHPVVERSTVHLFVPNDAGIDTDANRVTILTGPNMAGKSTYMRQVALIVLMAQAGSFVPAEAAEVGVADRIFTRVGASDDLATGQSTFMVEMTEVANILNNATQKSLILLDEIGRGTSTFDGLSIAWAVMEHIAEKTGARTLFATHYHELSELEGAVGGVANFNFAVQETGEDIIFLRRLSRGGADRSYGIHVARLAGLPSSVLTRARSVLKALGEADVTKKTDELLTSKPDSAAACGMALTEALSGIDVERTTPLEAIMELEKLKKIADSYL